MNGTPSPAGALPGASREEIVSALFAGMVIQQTNMALMLLGRMPHPETGETLRDIESAKMFIDQLEMLEAKTKGNLDKNEEKLLKQSLTALRMAFVEAVDSQTSQPEPASSAPGSASARSAEPARPSETAIPPDADEDSRKKFSKKY
jgi:hypothetical protein